VTFTASDTSPTVWYGADLFLTANAAPTSITTFDNGVYGQTITVKLDANTTLVHNSAVMRLRSGANLVSPSANCFVTLTYLSDIWFEVSRNFEPQSTYTPTNVSTDRAYDADTVAVAELADVVGTLIADLKLSGVLK
jgi:hypothetical protein